MMVAGVIRHHLLTECELSGRRTDIATKRVGSALVYSSINLSSLF
jgi:hypothetical protein